MFQNRLSRRRFLLGTSVVATGALLSACAPAPAQQPAAQTTEGGQASAEPINIVFHSRLGSHADWHKSRVPLFEEQNPGLTLQIDEIDGNEMYPKVYAMSASGTVGDVVWTYLNNPPEHKAKGVMIPLDDIVEAKNYDTSVFWTSLLEALSLDGQLHAIPNHAHYGTLVYYHNQDLFEQAGLELPHPDWTVDDVVNSAVAITNAPETWGIRANGGGQEHIPSYLRTFSGDLLSADGTQSRLLDENSLRGLRWLYDLKFTHNADPCLCGDQQRENFVAGNVGMFNTTPGLVAEFGKVTDWPFEWKPALAPVGPEGQRGSQVSGAGFCITRNSQHPNEAFEVLTFYATFEDGVEHVFGGAGSPGGRYDVWASERLGEISDIYAITAEKYPDGPMPWYRPANGRTSEFIDTMNNNLQAIWTEGVGFEEGVELTHELCQEVLDREPI